MWRPAVDFPVDALAREARSADLVVIGPMWVSGDAYGSLDPGEAILRLGRPALFVPGDVAGPPPLAYKHPGGSPNRPALLAIRAWSLLIFPPGCATRGRSRSVSAVTVTAR